MLSSHRRVLQRSVYKARLESTRLQNHVIDAVIFETYCSWFMIHRLSFNDSVLQLPGITCETTHLSIFALISKAFLAALFCDFAKNMGELLKKQADWV